MRSGAVFFTGGTTMEIAGVMAVLLITALSASSQLVNGLSQMCGKA